jgi:hypothetical protein
MAAKVKDGKENHKIKFRFWVVDDEAVILQQASSN